jgi:MHS family proline/betaine transporter-like MFS transporter
VLTIQAGLDGQPGSGGGRGDGLDDHLVRSVLPDIDHAARPPGAVRTRRHLPPDGLLPAAAFYNVAVYTILFYMPSYLTTTTGLDETTALLYILGMMIVIMIIPVGSLSDRIGRKPLIVTACIGFILLPYPAFLLLDTGTAAGTVGGLAILGLLLVLLLGTMSATLPALFDTDVRYGGFSIGYNISTSLFGGTAPPILALLVAGTGNNASPGLYVAAASLISLVAVVAMAESAGKPLPGSGASVLKADARA